MSEKLTPEQNKLIEDNHNLIYGFANRYKLDTEEWYGILAIELVRAAKTYNGANAFSTYVYKCMHTRMLNMLRYNKLHFPENYSLDYEYAGGKGDTYTIADTYVGDHDIADSIFSNQVRGDLLDFFESKCKTDMQVKALHMMAAGVAKHEVAKRLGVSHQAIYSVVKQLKRAYDQTFAADGSVRPVEVGEKIKIGKMPHFYQVVARDNRYIICVKPRKNNVNTVYTIIDLKKKIYGQDDCEGSQRYSNADRCNQRLKELQRGDIYIAVNVKPVDFFIA